MFNSCMKALLKFADRLQIIENINHFLTLVFMINEMDKKYHLTKEIGMKL